MFKKLGTFIGVILLLAAFSTHAFAQASPSVQWSENRGKAITDTVVWYASGALLGAKVRTDTLLGGTLEDTTYAIEYAGAKSISVTWITRAKGTDMDLIIYPYVSPDGRNTWRALSATSDIDSATPGRSNIAKDTVTQVLYHSGAFVDTVTTTGATTGSAFVHPLAKDMRIMETNRFLRFHVDPQMAASTDTVYVVGLVTRIYPQ